VDGVTPPPNPPPAEVIILGDLPKEEEPPCVAVVDPGELPPAPTVNEYSKPAVTG
jgi:hypothetical protein